jgi:hypothetical protein
MLSYSLSVSLHPIWTYIFVVYYKMEISGIALAGTITNTITYICMNYLMRS